MILAIQSSYLGFGRGTAGAATTEEESPSAETDESRLGQIVLEGAGKEPSTNPNNL